MGISHYLAMTAEEIAAVESLPENLAYMACHFSPYGTGLTGWPETLPEGAMLILNDRIPFCSHDQTVIADQLQRWIKDMDCSCLLLDFQRADTPKALGAYLAKALPCPVGIAVDCTLGTDYPVFLPPVPPDMALAEYLKPWTGREIWLEAEPETICITVDGHGSSKRIVAQDDGPLPFMDEPLCCCYRTEVFTDRAEFTLQRTPEDLIRQLEKAGDLGVTKAISLYQQMKKLPVK